MTEINQQSEKDKSRPAAKKGKGLMTRRNFIASAATMAAMNVVAGGAQKNAEKDAAMPIWSGD